jgi:anti-sigma regulatory factor (Ser/Thr protein kinase)
MSERRSFRFPRRADAVGPAREVAVAAVPGGLSTRAASDLRLLVSELFTNALMHGTPGDIRMDISRAGGMVRVEVTDAGGSSTRAEQRAPQLDGSGGFGLHVVEALASRWGADHGPPTRVWAELRAD